MSSYWSYYIFLGQPTDTLPFPEGFDTDQYTDIELGDALEKHHPSAGLGDPLMQLDGDVPEARARPFIGWVLASFGVYEDKHFEPYTTENWEAQNDLRSARFMDVFRVMPQIWILENWA